MSRYLIAVFVYQACGEYFFIVSQWILKHVVPHKYLEIASIPIYIISMCGICAVIDRAVKFFEYGYNYKKTRDKDIAERED